MRWTAVYKGRGTCGYYGNCLITTEFAAVPESYCTSGVHWESICSHCVMKKKIPLNAVLQTIENADLAACTDAVEFINSWTFTSTRKKNSSALVTR